MTRPAPGGRRRRLVRLVTAAALVAVPAVAVRAGVAAPPAYAIDTAQGLPGYCPDANGVTVVVDFRELGGTTVVRCAPGDQATGRAALANAGIQVTGTNRWGDSFICRIEGKPGPNAEPCIDTPPASAYWSYWHAPNDGAWAYSQLGVMNRKPPPGSFEGWSFSKDKTATAGPPPRIAPRRPAPQPVPPPANGTTGNGTSGGAASGGGGSGTGGSGTGGGTGGVAVPPANTGTATGGSAGGSTGGAVPGAAPPAVGGDATTPAAGGPATPPDAAPLPAASEPVATGPGVGAHPPDAPDEAVSPAGPADDARPATAPSGVAENGQVWTGGEELADTGAGSGLSAPAVAGFAALLALAAASAVTVVRRRRAAAAAVGAPSEDIAPGPVPSGPGTPEATGPDDAPGTGAPKGD